MAENPKSVPKKGHKIVYTKKGDVMMIGRWLKSWEEETKPNQKRVLI